MRGTAVKQGNAVAIASSSLTGITPAGQEDIATVTITDAIFSAIFKNKRKTGVQMHLQPIWLLDEEEIFQRF